MVKKVLIANRGEIAVRIIRACREMGISSVAIYSDVDRLSPHVQMADEAYSIGGIKAGESYLVKERIIEVAKKSGADAIHPGYGFLSENADFSELVKKSGLIFIGPPPSAIRAMGSKTSARKLMKQAGVPIVPGTEEGLSIGDGSASSGKDENEAFKIAEEIGYPILIKASAGGGGKGMRIVKRSDDLKNAFKTASSEAKASFGDGTVYIEKYLEEPRHIEIQILADSYGNAIHLGERECSIQRRHQKVVEEALSSLLDENMRNKMGSSAVKAAKACGYVNAGTIEFLVDKYRNYYFLEMNTRLQVEHPVTELITGIDLVKEQFKIASGEKLYYGQEDIKFWGHAIECRIYAEDPMNDFIPSIGKITYLRPAYGPGIREDSGIYEGGEISVYYDPMISKLIAWGKDRNEAISRMRRALEEYEITGVQTTIPFCLMVMNNENFIRGKFDTGFVEKEFRGAEFGVKNEELVLASAVASAVVDYSNRKNSKSEKEIETQTFSKWKILGRKIGMSRF